MKLFNFELNGLFDFLMSLELVGKQNRMRTRLCKLIAERLNEIVDERDKLILQFAETDEEGKPLILPVDGNQNKYVMKDMEAFTREYDLLQREEFILEETEERKDMLLTVASIVLNLDMPFKGQEALQYERYCEIFEQLSYQ